MDAFGNVAFVATTSAVHSNRKATEVATTSPEAISAGGVSAGNKLLLRFRL